MADPDGPALLVCRDLHAGWAKTQVLDGVSFELAAGETLAVLGRNGVGKTTLLSTLMGRARQTGGRLSYEGAPLSPLSIEARSRRGLALVPQEREIFRTLTVAENLLISRRAAGWSLERTYDLFPRLAERKRNLGRHLSGGEQQMLSIARALVAGPQLLMLDEPMEGLAPVIVDLLVDAIAQVQRESGIAILLVEQHVRIALALAERAMVLDRGRVVYGNGRGTPPDRGAIEALIAPGQVGTALAGLHGFS